MRSTLYRALGHYQLTSVSSPLLNHPLATVGGCNLCAGHTVAPRCAQVFAAYRAFGLFERKYQHR
jgi:hypothetical protein